MEFRNKYDSTETFVSECGSRFSPIYGFSSDKDGQVDLVITGQKDTYSEIQSHADSVDINTILTRYQMGDLTLLSQRNGQYIDVSDMPNNFTELLQKIVVAEQNFEQLPDVIKSEYSSVQEYVNDIGSDKWKALFGISESVSESDSIVKEGDKVE